LKKTANVLVLPGDGIGQEVMTQGLRVLKKAAEIFQFDLSIEEDLIHGQAWNKYGTFCRDQTVRTAKDSDGVLVGAVGQIDAEILPHSSDPKENDGLMRLRKELDVFAGLRPSVSSPYLLDQLPYRPEIAKGVDIMVLREMCGGVMFAQPRGIEVLSATQSRAYDTTSYSTFEIERLARVGFMLAERRENRIVSVDKANVMESGFLWREVVQSVSNEFPDVELNHMYADNCSYQLAVDPGQFDVLITDNLFGDIISDQAGSLAGSLGMLPSASLSFLPSPGEPCAGGIYEPVHGSAPDICGKNIANPIGMILSIALFIEYGLGGIEESETIRKAIEETLANGIRTKDIGGQASSKTITDAIINQFSCTST
jgi:3-isopropylmalate dehydrogenase